MRVISVLSLFEQQQERLPPVLMADTVLAFDDLPWAAAFSVQAQLKRMADLTGGCGAPSAHSSICAFGGAVDLA